MTELAIIINAIGCTLTVIVVVSLWAALALNTQTVGHPEDEPGEPQP